MVEETSCCLICNQPVRQGLTFLGKSLCAGCEERLLHASVEDEVYRVYLSRLRCLWPPEVLQTALEEASREEAGKRGEGGP